MCHEIDCLLIGHNEMRFTEYEEMVRSMGIRSGAYHDLNMNFIQYKGHLYTLSELYNLFSYNLDDSKIQKDLCLGDTFSACIAYLGTYLYRRNLSFDYINSYQNEKENLIELLKTKSIRVIAITTTLYVSIFPIIEIMSLIKQYNEKTLIVVGGPFVSTNVRTQDEQTLQYLFNQIGADYYINSSQGEKALADLISCIKEHKSTDHIDNLYYRKDSQYIVGGGIPEDNRLEQNMVDWSLFKGRVGDYVALRTAISCPFSCSFCGFPQHAGKYQTVGIEAVEYELNKLYELGTVKSINFIDDTFNVPPERFKDLLRMMIKKKYGFKWHSYFRCQFADREMLELMKESGCEGVFLGIESGSQNILEKMNKKVTMDDYIRGHLLLNEYDIMTFDSFITGFPGETEETVKETIQFIEDMKPTFYRSQLWYCETITPIWKKRKEYKINGSEFEWSHYTMDSETALNMLDKMFLEIKNSIWLPQYNFDFVNVFHLLHRGHSMQQIKLMVSCFADGIKEKLIHPNKMEISSEIIDRFQNICSENQGIYGKEPENTAMFDADFNF